MPESINEYLEEDMECEGLMECIYGFTELDKQIYFTLIELDEPLSIDEIADEVDRERSTAYRSIQRLMRHGFLRQEQVNQENGGYHHVYSAADPGEIADKMQRKLNDWYAQVGTLIHEFQQKYD